MCLLKTYNIAELSSSIEMWKTDPESDLITDEDIENEDIGHEDLDTYLII